MDEDGRGKVVRREGGRKRSGGERVEVWGDVAF